MEAAIGVTTMRCMTFFVIVALVALLGITGYNFMQIKQLNKDMADVKAKVLQCNQETGSQIDIAAVLQAAEQHAANAKALIAKGRDAAARIEFEKSLQSLDKAAKYSQKVAAKTGQNLNKTVAAAKKRIDEMWKEASRQNQKGRSESNGSK